MLELANHKKTAAVIAVAEITTTELIAAMARIEVARETRAINSVCDESGEDNSCSDNDSACCGV
jgi:hypothetical protein